MSTESHQAPPETPFRRLSSLVMACCLGVMALSAGLPGVVLTEFDPPRVFDAVENRGVTRFFIVPAALHLLLIHPDCAKTDFSRLKYILYGAAPIPLELLRQCIAMFGAGFIQAYGMTETTGTICMSISGSASASRINAVISVEGA